MKLQSTTANPECTSLVQDACRILDSVGSLVLVADSRADILYASPSVKHTLGYEPAEVLGQGWWNLPGSSPQQRDREKSYVARAAAGEIPPASQPYESMIRHQDGSPRWILWQDSVQPPGHLIGVGENITALKETRAALEKAQSQYSKLIETAEEGIWVLDPQWKTTFVNRKMADLLDCSVQQIKESSLFSFLYEEDRDTTRFKFEHQCEAKGTYELRFRRTDGSILWALCCISGILDEDMQCEGTLAMITDISDRRQAETALEVNERQFREVFEGAQDAMLIVSDAEGVCLDANAAAYTLFQFQKPELMGRRLAEFFRRPMGDGLNIELSRGSLGACEFVRKDNTVRKLQFTLRTRFVPGRSLWVLRDLTEQHALEEQLRQAQKLEAVGRLAGGIAHDFNNLLMVVSGYAELLQLKLGSAGEPGLYAREILDAARRASHLTSQLLTFSRKQVISPAVLDLNAVVQDTVSMIKRLLGERISVVIASDQSLGRVLADRGQLEQVILNLAINARDAMPDGGRLILETANATLDEDYCRQHQQAKSGEYVLLAVTDSGCGINPGDLDRIFEPFFTTKKGSGTGLGLATVYGIIKQAGGYIWVYSETDRGTTFKVYLPRVHESLSPSRKEASAPSCRASGTVLLVEDESGARLALAEFLSMRGLSVLQSADGLEAARLLQQAQSPIDILITDVVMPGLNGPELAKAVKARFPRTQVLFMSGYADHAVVQNGLMETGADFLQKPFTLQALGHKLDALLETAPDKEAGIVAQSNPGRG